MKFKEIKNKIDEINRSTGTKHVKVLISELCTVMKMLATELENIETPRLTVLSDQFYKSNYQTESPEYPSRKRYGDSRDLEG